MPENDERETAVTPQELRQILVSSFSLSELQDLAFDLGIDHEDIPGPGKGAKARELIGYLQRRGRLQELIERVDQLRTATQSPQKTTSSPSKISEKYRDIFFGYETGLTQLETQLGPTHPRYSDYLVYQQRLQENINHARRYGDTPTDRAQRSEIIDQLNALALSTTGHSFNALMDNH